MWHNPFEGLPFKERLFVRGRLFSAPLKALAESCPEGLVADIGCGHGALVSLLIQNPHRRVIAVDPDERKMEWARTSFGESKQVVLKTGDISSLLPEYTARLDAIVIADVLYLLPDEAIEVFLRNAHALLKPGGLLLVKETETDGSWKQFKCLAQEWLMVRLFGRTHSSGALRLLSRADFQRRLTEAGFHGLSVKSLARGYSSPHVLFSGRKS